MFKKALAPEEVFTPRSHDLNQKTYAERPALEKRLNRALAGHKFVIIHGESGNGKTWLYKRVFEQGKVPYQVVNLARMHNEGSLNSVLAAKFGELGGETVAGQKRELDVGIRPAGIGGGYRDTLEYKSAQVSPLELIAKQMYMTSGDKTSILVLDNFEQIIDSDEFVRQIASLIISADDEFVVRNKLKIMLVGTPTNIPDLISKVSNANTITNRVIEIPEVARLEFGEARHIMTQGFETHLKLTILPDRNLLYRAIAHKTDRIAQHIQELCLKIAQNAIDNNGILTDKIVIESEKEWMEETLSADSTAVENQMNSQRTTVGRKNQVLHCLGTLENESFNHHDVEKILRRSFTVEDGINLNIPQILAGFAKADSPLIRRETIRGTGYRFCSPKTRMVIRTKLRIDSAGNVIKVC